MLERPGKITIAIDGFSSCGKSTLACDLAHKLNYIYIDSGAMYRAVTLYFIRHDIDIEDHDAVTSALLRIDIRFRHLDSNYFTILNGEVVEKDIRTMAVNALVSPVAAIPEVRRALVAQQQRMGADKGVVMDGRDIGTVVFPDADLKIFVRADLNVRVQRRYDELHAKGFDVTRDEVLESLTSRDHIDSTRADSPLRQADDAVVMDNTDLSREEQLAQAYVLAQQRMQVTQ